MGSGSQCSNSGRPLQGPANNFLSNANGRTNRVLQLKPLKQPPGKAARKRRGRHRPLSSHLWDSLSSNGRHSRVGYFAMDRPGLRRSRRAAQPELNVAASDDRRINECTNGCAANFCPLSFPQALVFARSAIGVRLSSITKYRCLPV